MWHHARVSNPEPQPHPFAELLGFHVEQLGVGRSAAWIEVDERHVNPHGVLHGGVVFALVDTSMGGAATSVLEPGQRPATIEVQVRFLRAVTGGTVRAETSVIHPGRRVVQLESKVTDDQGRLVATGSGSFAVLS